MSESYDIFLSHSGAQEDFVEDLYAELTRQYGQYSVFYHKNSIKHGDSISSSIVENAKTCKLTVAVLSEEYFTRSKPPMLELAASYTALKNGNGVPRLFPVFFELRSEHAKSSVYQKRWIKKWNDWKTNERMSERISYESRTNPVEPQIWKEALYKLLDSRGHTYEPEKYGNEPSVFAKDLASVIVGILDKSSGTMVSYKATDLSDLSCYFDGRMEMYPDSPQSFDGSKRASTSGETHTKERYQRFDRWERASTSGKTHTKELYQCTDRASTSGEPHTEFKPWRTQNLIKALSKVAVDLQKMKPVERERKANLAQLPRSGRFHGRGQPNDEDSDEDSDGPKAPQLRWAIPLPRGSPQRSHGRGQPNDDDSEEDSDEDSDHPSLF